MPLGLPKVFWEIPLLSLAAYFVSDIHLINSNDENATRFLRFLKNLGQEQECSHVFLLGDIFDLWFSDYRFFQDRYRPIIDQIKRLVLEGVIVHYFEGNHDLHLKKFWQEQLGVQVHSNPQLVQLGPWKIRLEHGDQMDPTDIGYIFLRWLFRTSIIKFVVYFFPERFLIEFGEQICRIRQVYKNLGESKNSDTARAKMLIHGQRVFFAEPFDILIAGHFHVHEDRQVEVDDKGFRLINLGSWEEKARAFLLTEAEGRWMELS